jgi:UDP-N-acetylglucosamine acyltransferase
MTDLHGQARRAVAVEVHPTAVVSEDARLASGVTVGPYAVIKGHVAIGEGTSIGPHAVIEGPTEIGRRCEIFPFSAVGGAPQSLSHKGEATRLVIGDDTVIREFVTLSRGTLGGGGVTVVGNNNLLMAYTHVAHDCILGNGVVMANGTNLAGHVTVGDGAVFGGKVGVHQFVRIGRLSFLAGGSMVVRDVPPFTRVAGDRAHLAGLNGIGIRRAGLSNEVITNLKEAYRTLFRGHELVGDAARLLREPADLCSEVVELLEFIERSSRGISR